MNGEGSGQASDFQMVTLEYATLHASCESGSELAMWIIVSCQLLSTRSNMQNFLLSSSNNEIMGSNWCL